MRTLLAIVLGAALLAPAAALAAERGKCGEETAAKGGQNWERVRTPDGRVIIRIKTGFCIEGKVPKPSVIYVLNASTINYEWENLKQDFLPKIVKSVEKDPF